MTVQQYVVVDPLGREHAFEEFEPALRYALDAARSDKAVRVRNAHLDRGDVLILLAHPAVEIVALRHV